MSDVLKLNNPIVTSQLSTEQQMIRNAVYKATDRHPRPSKEKHTSVILGVANTPASCHNVIDRLHKRIEKKSWIVVIKALSLVHRLYMDGSEMFIDTLKDRSSRFFVLRCFSIYNEGGTATTFIKKYAKYLEEKCSVFRSYNFQFEFKRDIFKTLKNPLASNFKMISKTQSQLNALLNCKPRAPLIETSVLFKQVFVYLLKDAVRLYSMINDAIVGIMKDFWTASKDEAKSCLDIYKLYTRETDAILTLIDVGRTVLREGVPDIGKLDPKIYGSMEKHFLAMDGTLATSRKKFQDEDDLQVDSAESVSEDNQKKESSSEEPSSSASDDGGQLDDFVSALKQNFAQDTKVTQPTYVSTPNFQAQPVQFQPFGAQPISQFVANPNNPFATANPNPFATASPFAPVPIASAPSNPFTTNATPRFDGMATNPFGNITFPSAPFAVPQNQVVVQTPVNPSNPFAVGQSPANPFVGAKN